jgi:hypothetical protein
MNKIKRIRLSLFKFAFQFFNISVSVILFFPLSDLKHHNNFQTFEVGPEKHFGPHVSVLQKGFKAAYRQTLEKPSRK